MAVVGEVETRGATNDEHKGALGKFGAEPPEIGSVVAEKVPHVVTSALAWRDPALRRIIFPVIGSGRCKIWAEFDKPRTVDGVEEVVLGEMLDECVVRSAKAIKEGQENNVSLRDGKGSLA